MTKLQKQKNKLDIFFAELNRSRTKNTSSQYKHSISKFLNSEQTYDEYINSFTSESGARQFASSAKLWNKLMEKELNIDISVKVLKTYKKSQKTPIINHTELNKIILYFSDNKRMELTIKLLAFSGIRVSEVEQLNDFELFKMYEFTTENSIKLQINENKEKKPRTIFIPSYLAKEIYSYREILKKPFYDKASATKYISNCKKTLGINFSAHSFRSYFITTLYYRTFDIVAIQSIVGHADMQQTVDYISSDDNTLQLTYDDAFIRLPKGETTASEMRQTIIEKNKRIAILEQELKNG